MQVLIFINSNNKKLLLDVEVQQLQEPVEPLLCLISKNIETRLKSTKNKNNAEVDAVLIFAELHDEEDWYP